MADDTIRLDLELDDSIAKRQARQFITRLERDFKRLRSELSKALADGIADGSQTEEIKKLTKELNRLEKELKDVKKAGDSTGQGISKIGVGLSALAGIIAGLGLARLAQGFVNLAKDAFNATAALEQTTLALRSLTARELVQEGQFDSIQEAFGSTGERANELLERLRELARTSPFSREQVQQAFTLAQAYGFTSEEALRLTQNTLDLAAATGQSAEVIGRIALAFGQIQARGSLAGSELRQLQEAGFAANDVLDDLGFTLDDVSNGLVSADVFLEAASRRIEEDFGGAAARATNSLAGLASTLGDLRTDALVAFFEPAFQELQPLIADFAGNFDELLPAIRDAGEAFGLFVANVVGTLPNANEALREFTRLLREASEITTTGAAIDQEASIEQRISALRDFVQELEDRPFAERLLASIAGADKEVASQLEAIVVEIIRGAENAEEARDRLAAVFGEEAVGEIVGFDGQAIISLTGDIGNGFQELGLTFDELVEKAQGLEELGRISERLVPLAAKQAAQAAVQRSAEEALNREIAERNRLAAEQRAKTEAVTQATRLQEVANKELIISLVESAQATSDNEKETIKNAKAIFEQGVEANLTSEELSVLAQELGLLTPEQIAAQQEQNQLNEQLRLGTIDIATYAAESLRLSGIINGVASETARAASSVNTLSAAFRTAIAPERRTGGRGRRRPGTEETALRAEADALEAQADAIESQADAIQKRADAIQKEADAVQASVESFADLVREQVELTQRLEDAQAALDQAIEEGADAEKIDELRQSIEDIKNSTRDWSDELFQLATAAGASIDQLIQLGVITGEFTEQQAQAALASLNRTRGLQAIAEALADQRITAEQAAEAAAELNRQLEAGEQIDLTAFGGIDVTAVDTRQAPELLRDTADATRELADSNREIAETTRETAQASREAADALKEIASAFSGAGEASESLSEQIQRQVATQELQAAKTLEQQLAAIALADSLGLLTEEERLLLEQTARLDEAVRLLKLAKENNALTAEQYAEALKLVTEAGFTVQEAIVAVGGSLEELPDEVAIEIQTNAEEAAQAVDLFRQLLDELDGKTVETRIRVREEVTAQTGGTGAGSLPVPEDVNEAQEGGFFPGDPNRLAGVFHANELVVPNKAIQGGLKEVINFALSNVPNLRREVTSMAMVTPVSSSVLPSVTSIDNSVRGGSSVSNTTNGGSTVVNLFGEQAGRVARDIQNTELRKRQNVIMRRSDRSAL